MGNNIAHVKQDASGYWIEHSLEDHLREVGKSAAEMASGFNSESWVKVVGLWHDLGKYRSAVQADIANVTEAMVQETTNVKIWLRQTHADIMKHFAPQRGEDEEKMKVVPPPGVLIC